MFINTFLFIAMLVTNVTATQISLVMKELPMTPTRPNALLHLTRQKYIYIYVPQVFE